jgi:hypothetical protein
MKLLGQWTLPSGNRCTVALMAQSPTSSHTHLEWWPGYPPGASWSADDWSVYLLVVRPAMLRRLSEHTGRAVRQLVDSHCLTDLDLSHVSPS